MFRWAPGCTCCDPTYTGFCRCGDTGSMPVFKAPRAFFNRMCGPDEVGTFPDLGDLYVEIAGLTGPCAILNGGYYFPFVPEPPCGLNCCLWAADFGNYVQFAYNGLGVFVSSGAYGQPFEYISTDPYPPDAMVPLRYLIDLTSPIVATAIPDTVGTDPCAAYRSGATATVTPA